MKSTKPSSDTNFLRTIIRTAARGWDEDASSNPLEAPKESPVRSRHRWILAGVFGIVTAIGGLFWSLGGFAAIEWSARDSQGKTRSLSSGERVFEGERLLIRSGGLTSATIYVLQVRERAAERPPTLVPHRPRGLPSNDGWGIELEALRAEPLLSVTGGDRLTFWVYVSKGEQETLAKWFSTLVNRALIERTEGVGAPEALDLLEDLEGSGLSPGGEWKQFESFEVHHVRPTVWHFPIGTM